MLNILKTKDYSMFKFIKNNREVSIEIVNRLAFSIKKHGYIESKPILVNGNLGIIDGQHRFHACKKLGIDVVYVIQKNLSEDIILDLNTGQKNWSLTDFVKSRKEEQPHKEIYETMVLLKLSGTPAATIVLSGKTNYSLKICSSNNKIVYSLNPDRKRIIEFLLNIKDTFEFYHTTFFIRACALLFRKASTDHIKKLIDFKHHIKKCPTNESYLLLFESIINKGIKKAENKIHFFKY